MMASNPGNKLLLTLEEVAYLLGMSPRQVRSLLKRGRLPPPVRLDGRLRWSRKILEDWVAAGCPPPPSPDGGPPGPADGPGPGL
jgi:predicted DNA-binding transcriptional regulator AlpA